MKIFLNLIAISLFLASCEYNHHEADKEPYEISQKQIEYAESLLNNPAVISANWRDFKNLEVIAKPDKLGKNDDNDNDLYFGKVLADDIATKGHEYVGKDICVEIIYPDSKRVGYTCVRNK
ncbi:MAG: hypothetical protein AB7V12_06940 [Candidatus Dadabacteria bacterium]